MAKGSSGGVLRGRWGIVSALILLVVAFLYVIVLPILRPRGALLWGHYRLMDVYAGIPVILAALCTVVVLATPARLRRPVALRLTAVMLVVVPSVFVFDLVYTLTRPAFRQPDYWLDGGHISRAYSTADPELGFVRRPGTSWRRYVDERERSVSYRTDENGFRNAPGTKAADVVFIGDSFTEASWMPEEATFVGRVGAETGLRVVNLGRGAYGPQQELIVLQRFGLAYQPQLVVWQVFEGNDLTDAANFATWRADPRAPERPLKVRYWRNSALFRLFAETEARGRSGEIEIAVDYHDGARHRTELRYRFVPDQADALPDAFAETEQAITAGARLCESRGVRLAVVFLPTMVQVLEPFITFERAEDRERALPGGLVRSTGDFGSRLKAVCQKPACLYVDAFEALRARALVDNSRVFDRHDPDEHLDVDGHEVVARLIKDVIRPERGADHSNRPHLDQRRLGP
jgi:hypothetical protein